MASLTSTVSKERFLNAFLKIETLDATCQEIAAEIQCGHTKLYTVVEELGPLVTQKDVTLREKGISALSIILSYLPKDFLTEAELHFITAFYCDRLKDQHSVIPPVLKGVLAIVEMNHLPKESPQLLLRALFNNVQCQSHVMTDRQNIYLIFMKLYQSRVEALKAMGPDFIYGVISAIEGEKDPRNLMLLFSILPDFMRQFPLGHLTEEMFEVIACYFPVDFNSSASEKIGITRDNLAEKLAPCLYAVPEFAEFCIPLILEKLFATLKIAKLDSLKLLDKGVKTFGVTGLEQHLTELWPALRKEIMPGGDFELKNASLQAVISITDVLSSDEKLCESFINSIINDAKSCLYDVQLNLFRSAVTLLKSIAMVNKVSCIQILKVVVPLCLGQYTTKTSTTDKVILIETLNDFIKIASDHRFSVRDVPELAWTDIPQLYINELSIQIEELQLKILSGLVAQEMYLNKVHRTLLYDKICYLNETGSNEMRSLCQTSLLSLATLYTTEISALVKEKLQLDDGADETEVKIRKLEILAVVARIRELGIEVLPHLVSQMYAVNYALSYTSLTCLRKLLAIKNINYDVQRYLYNECNIIEKLLALNISPVDERLNVILSICRLIIRSLTLEEQQDVVKRYAPKLGEQTTEADSALIMNIFIPLRKNVDFTINLNLLDNLHNLALNNKYSNIRLITCQFLSVILNKIEEDNEYFQGISQYLKKKISDHLNSNSEIAIKKATVLLQVWLTKAIITKGSDVEASLNDLANVMKHEEIGQYLAQEYGTLASRHEDTLVEENFCTIRIFYKQRVFEHLIKQDREFTNSSRQNYLTALTQLFEEVPVELMLMLLPKLVLLLVESLSLDNEQVILSTLITLKSLLETKHDVFANKAQCFIPKLLMLSVHKKMTIRIKALECLANYCVYPVASIKIYKQDVLDQLAIPIDDPKRLVRKAATWARTQWFLVDAPIKER